MWVCVVSVCVSVCQCVCVCVSDGWCQRKRVKEKANGTWNRSGFFSGFSQETQFSFQRLKRLWRRTLSRNNIWKLEYYDNEGFVYLEICPSHKFYFCSYSLTKSPISTNSKLTKNAISIFYLTQYLVTQKNISGLTCPNQTWTNLNLQKIDLTSPNVILQFPNATYTFLA